VAEGYRAGRAPCDQDTALSNEKRRYRSGPRIAFERFPITAMVSSVAEAMPRSRTTAHQLFHLAPMASQLCDRSVTSNTEENNGETDPQGGSDNETELPERSSVLRATRVELGDTVYSGPTQNKRETKQCSKNNNKLPGLAISRLNCQSTVAFIHRVPSIATRGVTVP